MNNKFQKGAQNAVKCLNIQKSDRVIIISDREREHIARSIRREIEEIGCEILWLIIEDEVGERPAKNFPDSMKQKIVDFKPNVSYYIATGKKGELINFRWPLKKILVLDLKCRHGHMISIDDTIMMQGMSADYDEIYEMTMKVYEKVKDAKEIRVEGYETEVTATFDDRFKWAPFSGRIFKQGQWSNLPEGEVFTCPKNVNGTVTAYIIGDYFSQKYGILKDPLVVKIENSRVRGVNCNDKKLEKEFKEYIKSEENGDRVGEFAIGTLVSLKGFIGNLLQDEKFPGIHIAIGGTFPEHTDADWDCDNHVDIIPKECSIWVDGEQIMKKGKFLI